MTEAWQEDLTPVARSTRDPVATIVLPDQSFELEDLRELAESLDRAGLPVTVAESASQRRLLDPNVVTPLVIHVSPTVHDVFVAFAGGAAWDGVKMAFGRLRRTGDAEQADELTADVEIQGDRFHAVGPRLRKRRGGEGGP
jgi:hypothetical protein